MSYTIEKYYLQKVGKKRYIIKAKVIKRNWFGCITSICNETLDNRYKCTHQNKAYITHPQSLVFKNEAKIIIETLNKLR